MIIDGFCTCFGTFWGIFVHFGAFLAFSGIILACYACFQLQLEAGKALFRGLGRAKMPENVILGVSQAKVSGYMSVKVVPNTKGDRFRHV